MTAGRGLLAGAVLVTMQLGASASPAVVEDVPVPGGIVALAEAVGMQPVPDSAQFAAELVRLVYDDKRWRRGFADSRFRRLVAHFEEMRQSESALDRGKAVRVQPTDIVPIPLTAAVWSEVLRRRVAQAQLFEAVMSDADAAYLVRGLATLDDETLQFLVDHPAVVRRLYEDGAPAFAVFAEHLEIRANRVVLPGGEQAVPLWEALIVEKTTQPERFIHRLFTKDNGRLAYLYDTIGSLDSPRAAFALGLWIADSRVRLKRFTALGSAVSSTLGWWSVGDAPFKRPPDDLVSLFLRVQVAADGAPTAPASRTLWMRAFDDSGGPGIAGLAPANPESELIDAAWLVETLLLDSPLLRSERLDQFAFGQRVLVATDSAALPDVLVVLRAFRQFRMLMLTLDRIGVRRPELYARLVYQAERVSSLEPVRARAAIAEFQSVIAIIERLGRVRSIDSTVAEALLETLAAVPFHPGRGYMGELAPWLQSRLRPVLGSGEPFDEALLKALAGAPDASPAVSISWEGQFYRFDLAATEHRRLHRGRSRHPPHSFDVAIELQPIARRLATEPAAAKDTRAALARLMQLGPLQRDARQTIEKAIEDLSTMAGTPHRSQTVHVAASLMELVDVILGEALLAVNYEINLDVPRGASWTAASVAARHDFGLAHEEYDRRVRAAWAMPKRTVNSGMPWYVRGAALSLDIAVPSLALRRIDTSPLARPPAIAETERDVFATSVALMNPLALQNEDRDAIADAVARGRRRVDALAGEVGGVKALAREIGMDGWRIRSLQWNMRHAPQRVGSLFSMTELLYMGGGRDVDLNAWGMSATSLTGCICTRLVEPSLWTALAGRAEPGMLAATVADLNLHVAVALAEMRLPAGLAQSVLAIAVQEFVDRVQFSHDDDWLARVRVSQDVSRERIEDYIAAATVDGPLLPDTAATRHQEP